MKRILLTLLSVAALFCACQRDNYFNELGEPTPPPEAKLRDDGQLIQGPVAFDGQFPGKAIELYNALVHRASAVIGTNLWYDSDMVFIGEGVLSEEGDSDEDIRAENAYHKGVILAFVFPDYAKIDAWCGKKGIVFPGVPAEGEDRILLCAFSNRGWLYELDDPRYRLESGTAADYSAWLNPFVEWVNMHIASAAAPYRIGSGDELVFERNLACQKYDHTWFLALSDTVKVLSQMTCHFTSWPVTSAERDWFLCQARLSVNNLPMSRGVGVSESGAYRSKYCAYEMRQAGFVFDMGAGPQAEDGFQAGPLPQTTPAGETFSADFDWTLPEGGMFTEGPVTAHRSGALTAAVPPVHRGASTASFPDLGTENLSAVGVVRYRFTVPSSLLGYMHRTEIFPSEAQICRTGRDDLQATWVWRCPQLDIERIVHVSASTVYASMGFRSDAVGAGQWKDHTDAEGRPQRQFRLLSPGRVLTGQLQLVNDFGDGASCHSIQLWAEGRDPKTDAPDYDDFWTVVPSGETFVRNLETGRYYLQFYKEFGDKREAFIDIDAAQPIVLLASEL